MYYYEQTLEYDDFDLKTKMYWGIDAVLLRNSGSGGDDKKNKVISYYDCATLDDLEANLQGLVGRDACGACWSVSRSTLGFLLIALLCAALIFIVSFFRFFETLPESVLRPCAICLSFVGGIAAFISAGVNMDSCKGMIDQMLDDVRSSGNDVEPHYTDTSDRDHVTVKFPPFALIFSGLFLMAIGCVTIFLPLDTPKAQSLASKGGTKNSDETASA